MWPRCGGALWMKWLTMEEICWWLRVKKETRVIFYVKDNLLKYPYDP